MFPHMINYRQAGKDHSEETLQDKVASEEEVQFRGCLKGAFRLLVGFFVFGLMSLVLSGSPTVNSILQDLYEWLF